MRGETSGQITTLSLHIVTTAITTLVAVTVVLLLRRGLCLAAPIWKSTRRIFYEIHTEGSDADPVVLHYSCPPSRLQEMDRSTEYLHRTFQRRHPSEVRELHRLGAFPESRPICVVAKEQATGELYIMLRGRRFSEEDELFTTWRQAEIQIGDRAFRAFEGFVKVFREIEPDVKRVLLAHREGGVHIVGHSLGAGVGVLLAISLHLAFPHRIESVVLLANTRVAAPALDNFIRREHPRLWERVSRVVNECDPFCQLPLSYMPGLNEEYDAVAYTHIGKCVLLFQSICSNVSQGHELRIYHKAIRQAIEAPGG